MDKKLKGNFFKHSTFLSLLRLYTFYFPYNRGKERVYNFLKRPLQSFPQNVVTETKDGRRFNVSFRDWAEDSIYFRGTYDDFCIQTIEKHINLGDICLDVGANIGWYSTFFRQLVGVPGAVHAFEPVPQTFAYLKENVALNGTPSNLFLNNFALGDEEKILDIHIFEGLPLGHASLAARENQAAQTIPVQIKTLDSYLIKHKIEQIDFAKVDIEGAELMFLHGAKRLFEQKKLPVIFMEMALETLCNFGYKPNDLIEYIRAQADYDFYELDERREKLFRIEGFSDEQIGANVLCLPRK